MADKYIQDGWSTFLAMCTESQEPKSLNRLFEYLLTPEEHDSLAMRLVLTRHLLKKDLSQREISKRYGISISKITRGSNALKRAPKATHEALEALLTP